MNLNSEVRSRLRDMVAVDDFKENSLLRMIADSNLDLAIKIVDEFNGLYEYIPVHTWIYRNAIRRYLHVERNKIKSTKTLAKELGTSTDYIRKLLRHSKRFAEVLPEPPG